MPSYNIYITILLIGIVVSVSAQNLVPNPSFEELDRCPDSVSQVRFAPPWQDITSTNTSNVWHPCDLWGLYPAPNYRGNNYLEAHDGVGYAGLTAYSNTPDIVRRQYIQTELLDSMQANKSYYIEYYISPHMYYGINDYSFSNSIGLAITDRPLASVQKGTPSETGVVAEYLGDVLDEPIWTRVEGCYTAKGGEKNIIIGEFRRSSDLQVETSFDPNGIINTYIFVDNVGVYLFDPLPDTLLICLNETINLDASFLDATYLWSTGEESSNINISQSGYYNVMASMNGCNLMDEVYIIDPNDLPGLPANIELCEGEIANLIGPPGFDQYQWSTGHQNRSIIIEQAGNYFLTVSNTCGIFEYSTSVELAACDCNIYVPNVFSPNADGVNDYLNIFSGCDFPLSIKSFRIFDRWGALVYEVFDNPNVRWDGSQKGKPLPNGVYVWVLDYQYQQSGENITKQLGGNLTLLR